MRNSATTTAAAVADEAVTPADLDRLLGELQAARREVGRVVLGQEDVVDQLLIALICGGHVLLEGAPGLGKTLLVRTLATTAGLDFARIQFTPDLMPADVTGSLALIADEKGTMRPVFQPGPIFTQLLLADEINRATPKTQSALLEAMQERTITAGGRTTDLPKPFFVLATQNPIEMEGTYELPEAQIDRFLIKIAVSFPSEAVLDAILDLTTGVEQPTPAKVLSAADIIRLQEIVRSVPIASHVRRAIARFAITSQPDSKETLPEVRKYLRFGISPRGAQSLVLAAKGHALLAGRYNVSFADVRAVLRPALRHRFQLNFEGEADRVDGEAMIERVFDHVARDAG